jgi:hypothetical protein
VGSSQQRLPSEVLRDLVAWLKASRVEGIVIGGVAAAILGRPRATQDVDALVLLNDPREFLEVGAKHGFRGRIADPVAFARQSRVLLLRHEPTGIHVDISMAGLPFEEEAIRRGRPRAIRGVPVQIPIPTPEDLIIMKAVAHRPRDTADIEAILDMHPKIDAARVLRWVADFAQVLEMPELREDIEKLLKRSGKVD